MVRMWLLLLASLTAVASFAFNAAASASVAAADARFIYDVHAAGAAPSAEVARGATSKATEHGAGSAARLLARSSGLLSVDPTPVAPRTTRGGDLVPFDPG